MGVEDTSTARAVRAREGEVLGLIGTHRITITSYEIRVRLRRIRMSTSGVRRLAKNKTQTLLKTSLVLAF